MIYQKKINLIVFITLILTVLMIMSGCSKEPTDSVTSTAETNSSTSNNPSNSFLINGIVFLDANSNGVMDADEVGISDVIVKNLTGESKTDVSGRFELDSVEGSDQISVQQSSLPADFILTTGNDTQMLTVSANVETDPIGYADPNSSSAAYAFEDFIKNKSPLNNYYFELIVSNSGQPDSHMKLWVIDQSMKAEAEGMTTYYNHENGTMGVYTAQTNQVVITPIMETMPILTPFTFMDELDSSTFDDVLYKGEEILDGKEVLVFENAIPGFEAKYYVWKDYDIFIKMETKSGGFEGGFYFKDLTVDSVSMDDINYPAGAEILNLTGQ